MRNIPRNNIPRLLAGSLISVVIVFTWRFGVIPSSFAGSRMGRRGGGKNWGTIYLLAFIGYVYRECILDFDFAFLHHHLLLHLDGCGVELGLSLACLALFFLASYICTYFLPTVHSL